MRTLNCTCEESKECVAWRVHMFGKTCICCVSSTQQRDDIARVGCRVVQGYSFSLSL